MKKLIKPNTFIIGAQKSATTSLYNWISQHQDVCGPGSIKDYPFFLRDEFFSKGIESFQKEYIEEGFNNQKIIMQGSVQYIFEPESIKRIYDFNENAKLICVLRNPTERAISAYKYFKKLNIETLPLKEALRIEEKRKEESLQKHFDFTYKAHGLYAKQLKDIYEIFPKNQVLVLLYDEVNRSPETVMLNVFKFLDVNQDYKPSFQVLNATGKVKYQFLQKIIFNKSKVKKIFVDRFIDPIIPLHKRTKIRWAFNEWNTQKSIKLNDDDFIEEKKILKEFFEQDIKDLELMLNRNLKSWKK